jgi:hypothetical protein
MIFVTGLTKDELDKPLIGIAGAYLEGNPATCT